MRIGNVAAGLLAAVVFTSLIAPDAFRRESAVLLDLTIVRFGWFFLLTAFAVLLLMIYLAIGKHRNVRIGGPDARPEFSTPSWVAMLFAAGMGIGLVFFGAAEPLSHLVRPPKGIEAGSIEAARNALPHTFFHWGLHPWAIYGLMGLALGIFRYNHGTRGQMSDLLRPMLGRRAEGFLGKTANLLAILATVGGVATSLGFGAVQIGSGLSRLTGLPTGRGAQLLIIAIATVLFLLSASTGVHRGIKWLSNTNLVIAAALFSAVLVFGPTTFILDGFTNALGEYLNRLPSMSLHLSPYSESSWTADWTIFYWAWWISWSPFVGTFIARISKGRTIREYVGGVLLVPALVSWLWFATLGGATLYQELFAGASIAAETRGQDELVLFLTFEGLPLTGLLSWLAIVLLVIFFVTSADSATLVISQMASEGRENVPLWRKLLWGIMISAIAVVLLLSGGLEGLQTGAILSALPFAVVLCAVVVSLLRILSSEDTSR